MGNKERKVNKTFLLAWINSDMDDWMTQGGGGGRGQFNGMSDLLFHDSAGDAVTLIDLN